MKNREARQSVILSVRIRQDTGWKDASLRNLSSRGAMLQMDAPPPKGSFIEIRRGEALMVGQVRWSDGDRCGLRMQDKVPLASLLSPRYQPADDLVAAGKVERRAQVRVMSPAEIAERSRYKSALFQRLTLIAGALAAAIFLMTMMMELAGKPMATIAAHLG